MARRRSNKKLYFAEREEKAVVDYNNATSADERHRIYNEILREPFTKMVESILRKYQTHIGNYDIHEVEANALSHLVEQMVKFNPDKITKSGQRPKAFSYCQTIVRNFYKDHSRKSYTEKKTILSWEDHSSDILEQSEYLYEIDSDEKTDLEELIDIVVMRIRDRIDEDGSLKKNEVIVGEAIINVLSNWHVLFLEETPDGKVNKKITNKYQKNKILQLLKEQTRLNTKEIRMSMKPFKEIYYLQKKEFFEDEI
jgi:hypothetical protein